jgi:hypothetical protein
MTVSEMLRALDHDQIDAGFTVHTQLACGLVKEVVWTDRPAIACISSVRPMSCACLK